MIRTSMTFGMPGIMVAPKDMPLSVVHGDCLINQQKKCLPGRVAPLTVCARLP